MRSSTKRILVILGSFGLMMGSLYVYLSMIIPAYAEIQELRAERQTRLEILAKQTEAQNAINTLIGQYQSIAGTDQQRVIAAMLPTGIDIPSVVNQIQGMARTNALSIQSISFQYLPIKQGENDLVKSVGVIRVSQSLAGSYAAFKNYVQALETNVRLMDLNSLRIDAGARAIVRDVFSYNLVADVYYQ